jgi:serine/threonine-protein phosphatase 2A regulatory subunit B''
MAPYDKNERFFRLLKRPELDYITRDDFFPYIKELLNDHPVSLIAAHVLFDQATCV